MFEDGLGQGTYNGIYYNNSYLYMGSWLGETIDMLGEVSGGEIRVVL